MDNIPSKRAEIRDIINNNVGSVLKISEFPNPYDATHYLKELHYDGNVKRVAYGKYLVIKKVFLKKEQSITGKRHWFKKSSKDFISILSVLKGSEEGLVLNQIKNLYNQLTPPHKQISRKYLYSLVNYGYKQGILKHNGVNPEFKTGRRGAAPIRIVLVNKDITVNQWEEFVKSFRYFCKERNQLPDPSTFTKKQVVSKIEDSIISNELDLNKRLPAGFNKAIVKKFNINEQYARKLTKQIRNDRGCKIDPIVDPVIKPIHDILVEYNQVRANPIWQYKAFLIIKYLLRNKIPLGGAAMYAGTPASLVVCNSQLCSDICNDDLAIATLLEFVTDCNPFMVIGNAENPEKAKTKYQIWKHLLTTKKFPTILGKVTKESLYQYISWFAKKNKNHLCKVVVGHGGGWDDSSKPYSFKEPCEQLVKRYPNLHIISKRAIHGKWFNVMHLHDGITDIYKIETGGIVKCERCNINESSHAVEYKDDFGIEEICEECLDREQESIEIVFDF